MKIEYITREKVSLFKDRIPSSYSWYLTSPEGSRFVLISIDSVLSVYYVIAVTLLDEILYISDDSYTDAVKDFIKAES